MRLEPTTKTSSKHEIPFLMRPPPLQQALDHQPTRIKEQQNQRPHDDLDEL